MALREASERVGRVLLWNDPATGVMRHADLGYPLAIEHVSKMGLDLPSILEADTCASSGQRTTRRMPWKNGGSEILAKSRYGRSGRRWMRSSGASASPRWRAMGLSRLLEGVTRTLCVIQGAGVELRVGNAPAVELRTSSEPLHVRR